jgi:hypothetical protein
MTRKQIIITLDEMDCSDGCAVDEAIEKVQYLISEGYTSGNEPMWSINEIETEGDTR